MTKRTRRIPLFLALLLALSVGLVGWADGKDKDDDDEKGGKETIEISEARFFFELNETDEDLGVQLIFGADPWKQLKIIDPSGKRILDINGKGSIKEFGLSTLTFESNEPNFDEMSREDILALFPEGDYEFEGTTIGGDRLDGTATLTHNIPDGPEILTPNDGAVVDPGDVEVSWAPVTTPAGIVIESYEIIVTNDENSRFVYDIRMPADATSVTVPGEFFAADTEYELEVLAVEEGGNQTITVFFFKTG